MDVVVLVEEAGAELAGVGQRGEGLRELGQVLEGLELRFGERVIVRDPGLEWERVTPRSASSAETGLEVIEVPRSACTVCGVAPLRSMASAMKSVARRESSTGEMIQDGLNRE